MWITIIFFCCSALQTSWSLSNDCRLIPDKYDRAAMLERNVNYGHDHVWPGARVPYTIKGFTQLERITIKFAMTNIESNSCIRFVPQSEENNYVAIVSDGKGCNTQGLGYNKHRGKTVLNLERPNCVEVGVIVHELMHALGFMHEQSRPDRDNYLDIHWRNIEEDIDTYFQFSRARGPLERLPKCSRNVLEAMDGCYNGYTGLTYGLPYEYESVMHYRRTAFSKNGAPTMSEKKSANHFGNDEGLTLLDAKKLRTAYGCYSTIPPDPVTVPECKDGSATCCLMVGLCGLSQSVRDLCQITCGQC